MKKHPFSDGKTCDVDIKKVFSNSVGSQLPRPFPVSTIYIISLLSGLISYDVDFVLI